jgi:hypothetical protein
MQTRSASSKAIGAISVLAAIAGFISATKAAPDDTRAAKDAATGQVFGPPTARPGSGEVTVTVVDADDKPVAGAGVNGMYQSPTGDFDYVVADMQGTIKFERSLVPLVLRAATPDYSRAGVLRVDANAT